MCDMMMPKMPGDMFTLRRAHEGAPLPAVHLHHRLPGQARVVNFLSGLHDPIVLHKPVSNDELIRRYHLC